MDHDAIPPELINPPGFVQHADERKNHPPHGHVHDNERSTGTAITASTGIETWNGFRASINGS